MLAVQPDSDLARFCWTAAVAARPNAMRAQDDALLAAHWRMHLARFALARDGLSLLAETPISAERALIIATLRLLLADLRFGYALVAHGELASPGRDGGVHEDQKEAPLPLSEATSAGQAIETWLATAIAAGWHVQTQPDGWRLVRSQQQAPDLPPACAVRLEPAVLGIAAAVRLDEPLTPSTRQALAVFLLRQGSRHLARPLFEQDGEPATLVLDVPMPRAGLSEGQLADALAVVTAAYRATRWEILALADPALSHIYLTRAIPCSFACAR
jgi:hypothetical protein